MEFAGRPSAKPAARARTGFAGYPCAKAISRLAFRLSCVHATTTLGRAINTIMSLCMWSIPVTSQFAKYFRGGHAPFGHPSNAINVFLWTLFVSAPSMLIERGATPEKLSKLTELEGHAIETIAVVSSERKEKPIRIGLMPYLFMLGFTINALVGVRM